MKKVLKIYHQRRS